MKRFLSLLAAFALLFSCVTSKIEENADGDSTNNTTVQEIVEGPDLLLLDISEKTELFDEVLVKDEENFLFAKYYESGIVEEYLIISGIDTLLAFFDERGLPKLIHSQGKSILFGDFAEDSALVGTVDENGNSLVEGWDTLVNWKEYLEQLSKETTKATTMSKNIINNTQEEAIVKIIQVAVKKDYSLLRKPESWISYAVSTAAFLDWDNHSYQEFVSIASTGYNLSVIAKTVTPVLAKFPILYTGVLIGADLFLVAYDTYLIWDGVKTGKFGSLFNKSEEDIDWFYKELMGGVWLDESSHLFQWGSDETYDVRLHIGIANFDIDDLEWGFKGELEDNWLEVKTYNEGYHSHFTLRTLKPNEERAPERSCKLVLYVAGVYNMNKDIEYDVIQSGMGYFSEQSLTFSDMETQTVTFFSPAHESWKVLEHSSWLDVEDNSVQENRVIGITPTSLDQEAGYVIVEVESYKGGSYNVILPVYANDERSLCPDDNHPHSLDLGLSVKWSCQPLSEEEYAWGETETKEGFSIDNYKFGFLEKYYYYEGLDWKHDYVIETDGKFVLDLSDDAAHVKWGGSWRMPTVTEFRELHEHTIVNNGEYISSVNGALIPRMKTMYWTSSLYIDESTRISENFVLAWYSAWVADQNDVYFGTRYDGYHIWPVAD